MYRTKVKHSGAHENLKFWIVNTLLVIGCLWTFLILGGCKPSQEKAVMQESKDDITKYINNSVNEITPPEIMRQTEPPVPFQEPPPVRPQINASF